MRRGLTALVAALAAVVLAGCGNDVDDAGAEWPRRDLKIMAPADPGGGWDTTAREMARVIEDGELIPKSVEVYNVSGAGGMIGLAQLASKRKGEANQMMVMGLVMLGAIETNQAPLDVSDTTPIAALTSEPEAIVVQRRLRHPRPRGPRGPDEGGPGLGRVRRRLGRRHRPDPARPARQGGRRSTRARRSTSPTRAAARRTRRSSRARCRPASPAPRSSRTRSTAGKMRVLAVSTAEPVRVGGKEAPTIRDAGFDVVVENWRGVVAPPDILPAERDAMVAALERAARHAGVEGGARAQRLDRLLQAGRRVHALPAPTRTRGVDQIIADLGLGG